MGLVQLDRLAHVVHQASREPVGHRELQVRRVQQAHRVRPAEQDLLERLDLKVNKDSPGQQDQLDPLV